MKEIILAQEKNEQIQWSARKRIQQYVKKCDNVTAILVDSVVKDIKGQQKVVVKSFRGVKASCMYWHAKPTKHYHYLCGTYDISKDADLEKVATDIISLSKSVSWESRTNIILYF